MTDQQRRLRMNIRNAYFLASTPELERELARRTELGRSDFELGCFRELIQENS